MIFYKVRIVSKLSRLESFIESTGLFGERWEYLSKKDRKWHRYWRKYGNIPKDCAVNTRYSMVG